jgi:hypothetical protein
LPVLLLVTVLAALTVLRLAVPAAGLWGRSPAGLGGLLGVVGVAHQSLLALVGRQKIPHLTWEDCQVQP